MTTKNNMPPQPNIEEVREKLADIEHQRWSDWQKYMHSKCYEHTLNSLNSITKQYEDIKTGHMVIPKESFIRWERQIATPYSELSEAEKESDRKQVDRYWSLIEDLVKEAYTSGFNTAKERAVACVPDEIFMEDHECGMVICEHYPRTDTFNHLRSQVLEAINNI